MTAAASFGGSAALPPQDLRRAWLGAGIVLAIGLLCLGTIFWPEIVAAVRVWSGSTAYNHCFLVLPVAIYLAWDRRDCFKVNPPQPAPWFALAALPVAAAWLVAQRIGIMEGRQLLAMTLLQILFLSVLGLRSWRGLSAPFLYLYFLVPFGAVLTPFLQHFTVSFMTNGLDLLHIPNFSNGIAIEIPAGTFLVAEACAGLRFLIASIAFGALYACVIYRSFWRRFLFIAVSLVVPVIANGFRALGIVVLAHFLGNAKAAATDHVLYGWLFFSIVIFLLILLGLPFREPPFSAAAVAKPLPRAPAAKAALFALIPVLFIASAPRILANRLDRHGAIAPVSRKMSLPLPSTCVQVALSPELRARFSALGITFADSRAYGCSDGLFLVSLMRYPARIGAHTLFAGEFPKNAGEPVATRGVRVGKGADAQLWRVTEFTPHGRYIAVASALWIDGRPVLNAIKGRILQALNLLRKAPLPPVKAVVVYRANDGFAGGRLALNRFLAGTGTFSARLAHVFAKK